MLSVVLSHLKGDVDGKHSAREVKLRGSSTVNSQVQIRNQPIGKQVAFPHVVVPRMGVPNQSKSFWYRTFPLQTIQSTFILGNPHVFVASGFSLDFFNSTSTKKHTMSEHSVWSWSFDHLIIYTSKSTASSSSSSIQQIAFLPGESMALLAPGAQHF